jgi:uncharacterized protein (TIGR00251 family)
MPVVQDHPRGATISLTVQPRASRTEIMGEQNGALRVRLAAPPVDGAANAELLSYFAKLLGVRRGDLQILSGEHGRRKVVLVTGGNAAKLRARLGL